MRTCVNTQPDVCHQGVSGWLVHLPEPLLCLSCHHAERATVLLGKAVHYSLLLLVPGLLHGWKAALVGAAAYR